MAAGFVWNEEIGISVAGYLFDTDAYQLRFQKAQSEWFSWNNGITAPFYSNSRYLNQSGKEAAACATYLETIIRVKFSDAELIVGPATSGVSWSSRVSNNLQMPMCFVRSTPKKYSSGDRFVEGNPPRQAKAVIIDDTYGSGDSIAKTIKHLRNEFDITVIGVVTVINWGYPDSQQRFADEFKVPRHYSLTSYPQIIAYALMNELLTRNQADQIRRFYETPLSTNLKDRIDTIFKELSKD